jgi:hypothetical protein
MAARLLALHFGRSLLQTSSSTHLCYGLSKLPETWCGKKHLAYKWINSSVREQIKIIKNLDKKNMLVVKSKNFVGVFPNFEYCAL